MMAIGAWIQRGVAYKKHLETISRGEEYVIQMLWRRLYLDYSFADKEAARRGTEQLIADLFRPLPKGGRIYHADREETAIDLVRTLLPTYFPPGLAPHHFYLVCVEDTEG